MHLSENAKTADATGRCDVRVKERYFDLSGEDDWLLSVPRAKTQHPPVSPQLCSRPIWQGAFNSARDRGYPTAAHRISGLIVSRTTRTGAIPSAARWPRIGRADIVILNIVKARLGALRSSEWKIAETRSRKGRARERETAENCITASDERRAGR